MKTIQALNSWWWYRFIKVLYIGSLALFVVGANAGIYFSYGGLKTLNYTETQVLCLKRNSLNPAPYSLKEINSYSVTAADFENGVFKYKEFFEGYNDYAIKKILEECQRGNPDLQKTVRSIDIFQLQRHLEVVNSSLSEEEKEALSDKDTKSIGELFSSSDKVKYLDFSAKLFDIVPVFNYTTVLLNMIGISLGILVFFELIRHIFYYIFLGSFRPKKKE